MKKSRNAEDVLGAFPSEVQDLAREARRLLLKLLPGAAETVDPTAAVLSYGYGSGYRGMICTVLLSKSGVKHLATEFHHYAKQHSRADTAHRS